MDNKQVVCRVTIISLSFTNTCVFNLILLFSEIEMSSVFNKKIPHGIYLAEGG